MLPFAPNIYGWITTPDYHYIYEIEYEKNPVHEWNRQIERLISELAMYGNAEIKEPPKILLKEIGKEIYKSLPAMLSGIGFKPFDSSVVKITNLTNNKDLHNIKVHFIGCKGFDSFKTYPDRFGSIDNKDKLSDSDSITIKYPKITASPTDYYRTAHITYYGADTSKCDVNIDVELNDGTTAKGKKVIDNQEYLNEQYYIDKRYDNIGEFIFKFLVIGILLVFYYRKRKE